MPDTVIVIVVVGILIAIAIVLVLRAKAASKKSQTVQRMMADAPDYASAESEHKQADLAELKSSHGTFARSAEFDDSTRSGMESMRLSMREFAFKCAKHAKTKEAAYAKSAPMLKRLNGAEFTEFIEGTIDDFLKEYGDMAPIEREVAYAGMRHEREQFQLLHGMPLKALDEEGFGPRKTYAQEIGLTLNADGRWAATKSISASK